MGLVSDESKGLSGLSRDQEIYDTKQSTKAAKEMSQTDGLLQLVLSNGQHSNWAFRDLQDRTKRSQGLQPYSKDVVPEIGYGPRT